MPASTRLSTRANVAWTLGGRVVYGASQAAALMVLFKLGDLRMVGQFTLALAITAPVSVLVNLQLRNLFATDTGTRASFATYLRLRWRASAVGVALLFTVAAVGPYSQGAALSICIVALAKAAETAIDLHHGVFQRYARMDYLGQSLALRGIAGVLALACTVTLTGALAPALAAMAGAWLLVLLLLDRPRSARVRTEIQTPSTGGAQTPNETPTSHSAQAWRLLWVALPLGVVTLLDSLTQNTLRYVVEAFHGEEALGMFASMAYLVTLGSVVVFAVGTPIAPALARHYAAGQRRAFGRLALTLIGIGAGIGIAAVAFAQFFGETVLAFIYTPAFVGHGTTFVWVMLAGAFHYVLNLTLYILTAARTLRAQPLIYALALVVSFALAMAWVPKHGLLGAAQAMAAGWAVAVVLALGLAVRAFAGLRITSARPSP